ncbi:MAG: DUF882 domain-containing protein [Polyangiaceae bacterium]
MPPPVSVAESRGELFCRSCVRVQAIVTAYALPRSARRVRAFGSVGLFSLVSLLLDASLAHAGTADITVDADAAIEREATEIASLMRWLEPFTEHDAIAVDEFAFGVPTFGSLRFPTSFDWMRSDWGAGQRYRFADLRRFSLLERYVTPSFEQFRSSKWLFARTLDPVREPLVPELDWRLDGETTEAPFELANALRGVRPETLPFVREKRCARWEKPSTVLLTNSGPDYDRFALVDCDGSIAQFATDRISVLARLPNTPNPGTPLPEVPNPPPDWPEEWIDGIRLLNPRLLWVVQQIDRAFPRHAIQILSGYRRDPKATSRHRQGRALDIKVNGVDNKSLFAFCRTLKDVGCGYYPNHPFVHVDVRPAGAKSVAWVDISTPGAPSQYVDSWPGVLEAGSLSVADGE